MNGDYSDHQLIEKYLELRSTLELEQGVFDARMKPLRDGMELIENVFLARFNERKSDNSKVKGVGTAYRSNVMSVKIVDRDKFMQCCFDNWTTFGSDMLQISATKGEVSNFIKNDPNKAPPPGLDVSYKTNINIRRT